MLNQITSAVLNTITQKSTLTELVEDPKIHLSDWLLEDYLVESFEEVERLSDVAVYGYQDHLRIVTQVRVGSQWREALIKITPERVLWGNQYQLVFQLELLELTSRISNSWLSFFKGLVKDQLWDIIPLGSIISKLSEMIVHKIFERLGTGELQHSTVDVSWVTVEGKYVTVDLERSPHLEFLWTRPSLPVIGDQLPRIVDCFKLTEISAHREGLTLHIELHPTLKRLLV